ncbi:unnamed protein product [Alopecurus aequalis]
MIQVSRLCAGIGCGGGGADDASLSSSLIHDFLVAECSHDAADGTEDDFNDDASPASAPGDGREKSRKAAERITTLLGKVTCDRARLVLSNHVSKESEEITELRPNRPAFRRALAGRLRAFGYDAGICHTSWPGTSEVAAGNYEYIDVIIAVTGKSTAAPGDNRYIVDVGFSAEFVVARPTGEYALVLDALPSVLVARPKEVKQVVNLAAKAARRSLKSQGLAVPPWRKKRFMAAKWLGPHSRTAETAAISCDSGGRDREATCCTVGFVLGPRLQPWQSAERGLA